MRIVLIGGKNDRVTTSVEWKHGQLPNVTLAAAASHRAEARENMCAQSAERVTATVRKI